jgi:hypothetical protein
MLLFWVTYPFCLAAKRRFTAMRQRAYVPWTKIFKLVQFLDMDHSQFLNSFIRKSGIGGGDALHSS